MTTKSMFCLAVASLLFWAAELPHRPTDARAASPVEVVSPQLSNPVDYIVSKLHTFDLVIIGERHWTREEPLFLQQVLRRTYAQHRLQYLFLECGRFEDQAKVERFLASSQYDPSPILEVLRNTYELGWGYQEYFDIFRLVYEENHKRPPSEWVKIVLVNGPPEEAVSLWFNLQKRYIEQSLLPGDKTRPLVGWLNDATRDRDWFMAHVIAMHLFQEGSPAKGVYFAGGSHIRKCLDKKDYGRRYFPVGGLLEQMYPGHAFAVALHLPSFLWWNTNSLAMIERMFVSSGKPLAFDTGSSPAGSLKVANRLLADGCPLREVFDGYVILNVDAEYHPCVIMPEVYTDDFAKGVWGQLEKNGMLERFLPPETRKNPSGKILRDMIGRGLH